MGTQPDARLKRLLQKPHLLRDRKRFAQGRQAAAISTVQNNWANRYEKSHSEQLNWRGLLSVAVSPVALWVFFNLPLNRLLFEGFQQRGQNRRVNLGGTLFSPSTKPLIVSFGLGILITKRRSSVISPNGFLLFF